ncbi:hypothetical protein [Aureimonas sp. AU20]|uniref:hypothetical protein n=1 Tax=Aureimonas sp. AU20 TaxID=1349819 RepID=UPI000720D0CB|nr:hypothetical protein [Aureimonas sp. AU20]ALN73181.1 hypothetical protein M673_10650 [Aureimonas sp. AU20]
MNPVAFHWQQAWALARDKRLKGDDLRAAVIGRLAINGDPRTSIVSFVAASEEVTDLAFRSFVIALAVTVLADAGRVFTDAEADARVRKVARDLDISELRAGRALDSLAPVMARAGFGGAA